MLYFIFCTSREQKKYFRKFYKSSLILNSKPTYIIRSKYWCPKLHDTIICLLPTQHNKAFQRRELLPMLVATRKGCMIGFLAYFIILLHVLMICMIILDNVLQAATSWIIKDWDRMGWGRPLYQDLHLLQRWNSHLLPNLFL